MTTRPTLAVWKFASCDGCQLSVLDCERELISLSEQVEIAHFLEASSAIVEGPYDVSLVEGSVTTAADAERIQRVRQQSKMLITIGACATSGGIRHSETSPTLTPGPRRSTRTRSTWTCWARPRRSPSMCGSTTNCAAARSTKAN